MKSGTYSIYKLYQYKKLINALYNIYGPDCFIGVSRLPRGKYCGKDFSDLSDKGFDFLSLRSWEGVQYELLPCDLSFDKNEKVVQLTIFGAKISLKMKALW